MRPARLDRQYNALQHRWVRRLFECPVAAWEFATIAVDLPAVFGRIRGYRHSRVKTTRSPTPIPWRAKYPRFTSSADVNRTPAA